MDEHKTTSGKLPSKESPGTVELDHETMHALGIAHTHEHGHDRAHGHGHTHSHEHTKAVQNRLSRAIGHLQSVKRMVDEGRDCADVLIQLSAVQSALQSTGKVILEDHLRHCIVEAAKEGDNEAIEDLCKAIRKLM